MQTLQRKMLRTIVGTRRLVYEDGLEEWVEWIVRSTRAAEQVMSDLNIPDWVEEIHRRKFRWAGRTALTNDGRWTREVLLWSAAGSRKRGRPRARWTDPLNKLFQQGRQATNDFWFGLAQDKDSWVSLEENYVDFVLGRLSEV